MANQEQDSLEQIEADISRLQILYHQSTEPSAILNQISLLQTKRFKLQYDSEEGVRKLQNEADKLEKQIQTWAEAHPIHSRFLEAWDEEQAHAHVKDSIRRGKIYREAREKRIELGNQLGVQEEHLQLIGFATSAERLPPFFEKLGLPYNGHLLTTLTTLYQGRDLKQSKSSINRKLDTSSKNSLK